MSVASATGPGPGEDRVGGDKRGRVLQKYANIISQSGFRINFGAEQRRSPAVALRTFTFRDLIKTNDLQLATKDDHVGG